MGVKKRVFASASERTNFYKLDRRWGDKYRIYHNLPFLNVFTPTNLRDATLFDRTGLTGSLTLSDAEFNRLKKTSIDYVLCDADDQPILAIEFDGLCEGFSAGVDYHPVQESGGTPWRKEFMELKLRVAHGSSFPYYVLGSDAFEHLAPDVKVMVVDGIIGQVLSAMAAEHRHSPEEHGYTAAEFDALPIDTRADIVEDFVIFQDVQAETQHNPISKLEHQLKREVGYTGCSLEPVNCPSNAPLQDCLLTGLRVVLHTPDQGDIARSVMLPSFKCPHFDGWSLCKSVGLILAMIELKRRRAQGGA
jgi:hypothetical protein